MSYPPSTIKAARTRHPEDPNAPVELQRNKITERDVECLPACRICGGSGAGRVPIPVQKPETGMPTDLLTNPWAVRQAIS